MPEEEKVSPVNFGKEYSDEQLAAILSEAPTKANAAKFAAIFGRSDDAITMIYRWASTPVGVIEERERGDHAFVQQIVRVRKQLGWVV